LNTIATSLDTQNAVRSKNYGEDEIDLLGIFPSIGKVRKPWLLTLVLVGLVYFAYATIQYFNATELVVYRKAIEFTFPGVENGHYPNESRFSLEDIITPVIVNDVYHLNNLQEYGISADKFRTALTIEPYAPDYFMIVAKYNHELENKRLTAAEIGDLQARMRSELSTVNKGAAMLSLHLNKIALPEPIIEKVMTQIPEIWAQRSVEKKGVLNLNVELATSRAIDKDFSNQIDYMLISDYLAQKTTLVEDSVTRLLGLEDAASLIDEESGLKLADVQQEIADLRRYVIDEIMSPVRSLGLSRNVDMALYYYQDKRETLKNKLDLVKNQAALLKDALAKYTPNGTDWRGADPNSNNPVNQFSSDAIDKIISLSSEVKSEEYRQGLNREWLDLEMKSAQLEHDIGEADRLITALKHTKNNPDYDSIREEYLTQAEKKLPEILNRLREYLDITQRIYHRLSLDNIGVNGYLYRSLSNKPYIKETAFSIKNHIVMLIALLFLTSLVTVPVLMIRNALRERARNAPMVPAQ
jgi:hypothetical protein